MPTTPSLEQLVTRPARSGAARRPQRPRRSDSEGTVAALLEAALVEFSRAGFDGTATRAIAARAGCHQPQINYHFASKETLWREAVDRLFADLDRALDLAAFRRSHPSAHRRPELAADRLLADAGELIARFVRFCARRPELARILSLESTADTVRLDWLVARHVRPRFEAFDAAWTTLTATGGAANVTALFAYEALVGLGPHPFAHAPVVRRYADVDPTSAVEVDAHVAAMVDLLLPGLASQPAPDPAHPEA